MLIRQWNIISSHRSHFSIDSIKLPFHIFRGFYLMLTWVSLCSSIIWASEWQSSFIISSWYQSVFSILCITLLSLRGNHFSRESTELARGFVLNIAFMKCFICRPPVCSSPFWWRPLILLNFASLAWVYFDIINKARLFIIYLFFTDEFHACWRFEINKAPLCCMSFLEYGEIFQCSYSRFHWYAYKFSLSVI